MQIVAPSYHQGLIELLRVSEYTKASFNVSQAFDQMSLKKPGVFSKSILENKISFNNHPPSGPLENVEVIRDFSNKIFEQSIH